MLKKITLSMMSVFALAVAPSHAEEFVFGPYEPFFLGFDSGLSGVYGPNQPLAPFDSAFQRDEQGLSLKFAGKKQDGALSFFMTSDSFSAQENDAFANELNTISPAAGIQFTMDFNL